jgi:hypothetical protein
MNKQCSRRIEHPADVFRNLGMPVIYCRDCAKLTHLERGGLKGEFLWWKYVGDCSCGNRIFASPSAVGTDAYPKNPSECPKWLKALDCGRCVSPEDVDAEYRQAKAAERARQDADIERLWPMGQAYVNPTET